MAASAKRQFLATHNAASDLSHATRPAVPSEIQSSLLSCGMRTRKAMSDHQFKKELQQLKATTSTNTMPIWSNSAGKATKRKRATASIQVRSAAARDPFAAFKAQGRLNLASAALSGPDPVAGVKRSRDEEMDVLEDEYETNQAPSIDINAFFEDPPWLSSQDSFQDEDEQMRD